MIRSGHELRTERLLLRRWQPSDRAPFAALNADPRTNEFLTGPLTQVQSDELASRIDANFDQHGFGLWVVEVPDVSPFIGFIGLAVPQFDAQFTPCVEIGWRLRAEHWGRGYATEGARAALAFGFEVVGLPQIVSFTVPANVRSRRVMEKIGMKHDAAEDFDHPALADGHPLQRHVLYRITRPTTAT
jgi:RimJ/RimL family protein N-acetyltransferase